VTTFPTGHTGHVLPNPAPRDADIDWEKVEAAGSQWQNELNQAFNAWSVYRVKPSKIFHEIANKMPDYVKMILFTKADLRAILHKMAKDKKQTGTFCSSITQHADVTGPLAAFQSDPKTYYAVVVCLLAKLMRQTRTWPICSTT
jgi:hypothetical protein